MGSEPNLNAAECRETGGWFSWTQQSDKMLRNVEKRILSCIKTPYKGFYVDIGPVVGKSDKVWTVSLNNESKKAPLVMLHGMAAGLALWCPNFDAFATKRPVYAIDLLGFARSSRPKFSTDAAKTEEQWVESIEEWRREVNLSEFILLGHSLGGYIATAYAMKYPDRVCHLILADPWGFVEKPDNIYEKYKLPLWVRVVATLVQPLNPLWAIRAAGPAGKWLLGKARSDITRKYVKYVPDAEFTVPEYIYQCNSQTPSGEAAFHTLRHGLGWAKNPMVNRLDKLDADLPVTVLNGAQSWVENPPCQVLTEQRGSNKTYVQVISGAGHHIYLDKPELFNKYVLDACSLSDEVFVGDVTRSDDKTRSGDKVVEPEGNAADVEPTPSLYTPL